MVVDDQYRTITKAVRVTASSEQRAPADKYLPNHNVIVIGY